MWLAFWLYLHWSGNFLKNIFILLWFTFLYDQTGFTVDGDRFILEKYQGQSSYLGKCFVRMEVFQWCWIYNIFLLSLCWVDWEPLVTMHLHQLPGLVVRVYWIYVDHFLLIELLVLLLNVQVLLVRFLLVFMMVLSLLIFEWFNHSQRPCVMSFILCTCW